MQLSGLTTLRMHDFARVLPISSYDIYFESFSVKNANDRSRASFAEFGS
jgi:hypothetical protein